MTDSQSESTVRPDRFLVLAHADDAGAVRVAAALEQRRGPTRVTFVSDAALAQGRWVHRLDASGTNSSVALDDGRLIAHDEFDLVFNRLRGVFPSHFAVADEADRRYAQAEINALLLSWLASFPCPVVPAPSPPSLSPELPPLPELLARAGRAGLPTRSLAFSSDARAAPVDDLVAFSPEQSTPLAVEYSVEPPPNYRPDRGSSLYLEPVAGDPRRLLVVGDDVLGPVPDGFDSPSVRFARDCECEVLSLLLDRRITPDEGVSSRWCLCDADARPALADRDEAVAVARYLERRAERRRTDA